MSIEKRITDLALRVKASEIAVQKVHSLLQDNKKTDEHQRDTEDKQTEANPSSLTASHSVPPHPKKHKADAKWQKLKNWLKSLPKQPLTTYWKPRIEIVGIFFAAGYAVVTWRQWRDLRRNFAAEQRPYVSVVNMDSSPLGVIADPQGSRFYTRASITNFGKSPALHVVAGSEILAGDDSLSQTEKWFKRMGVPLKKTHDIQNGFYTLGNGIGTSERIIMQGDKDVFDAMQISNGFKDTPPHLPAIVVGRIEYYDMAGNFYWTDICFAGISLNNPSNGTTSKAMVKCPTHNELH